MPSNLQQFKKKAFAKPGVQAAYDGLNEEFALLEEVLKALPRANRMQASRLPSPRHLLS